MILLATIELRPAGNRARTKPSPGFSLAVKQNKKIDRRGEKKEKGDIAMTTYLVKSRSSTGGRR